jgi:hypothetical protein
MTSNSPRFVGNLGPYESILADWATFVTKLGYRDIAPNTIEFDDAGLPRLCYVKWDGEPLRSNSGGDPYRKITIGIELLNSARPN